MISIVTCSVTPAKLQNMVTKYHANTGEPIEIVHIDDAKSLAEGYNRGIDRASGDVIVFSHDDAFPLAPGFGPRLRKHLEAVDIVGGAGTQKLDGGVWFTAGPPYVHGQVLNLKPDGKLLLSIFSAKAPLVTGIQALDGFFMATSAGAAQNHRFDERFAGFHLYDLDWSYGAFQSGAKVGVATDLFLGHQSAGGYNDPAFLKYMYRFIHKWGDKIADPNRRNFSNASVEVSTVSEAIELMSAVVGGQPIMA